ncbi:MAG: DUF4382 domain-containing protein [Gammaproteobacteria bacterium]|nr:DUF4382 domain-containing protein [Gammaproteobacteria bacterium]MDH5239557.1 DUF4382 domain-containing protein [Gammaproteobacteria bacterium]
MNVNCRISTLAVIAALVAACGGSGSDKTATTGFLSLGVSDSPVHSADKVCITFNEIELKSASETTVITLDPPRKVNLLSFQGANAAPLLIDEEVTAGDYQWMRLGVDAVRGTNGGIGDTGGDGCDGEASYIVMEDSSVYNLYVPSGANTGLKLVSGFTVPANGSPDFTAEFDLARSITAPPGLSPDVVLKPVIRLVNNVEVGTLTGVVATELATAEACEPSVYVFDDGVTPNPIGIDDDPGSTETDPNDTVATAMVNEQMNNDGSVEWNYTIGFMLPGNYEAAFTCDGETFEPADGKPALIEVNGTAEVNFEVPMPL